MTLKHYKNRILDFIKINESPQNWRLYEVLNDPNIKLKRLLKDMERERLISITFENDKGKILRKIKSI